MSDPVRSDLLAEARRTLAGVFGFPDFRPGQREIVERILAGRSALAVFATGSGKSLCYQLPALLLPGVTVVVSPLIALMKDQIDFLASKGVAAARLDSSLTNEDYASVSRRLRSGELKILFVAPERFTNERFLASLERVAISLFTVDEAHCVSQWGHAFRPDYLLLARAAERYGAERVLALTATATEQVRESIAREFRIAPEDQIVASFHRPNLSYDFEAVDGDGRDQALLSTRFEGPTIVYATLQATAEHAAELLAARGLSAVAYHAGLGPEERARIQDDFMQDRVQIVCATIAFGMGIDKADIRGVVHYNLAKTLENYAQETGRAGRDGRPSVCKMLVSRDDLLTLSNFTYGDTPSRAGVDGVLAETFATPVGAVASFDLYRLAADHDIRLLVLETLLTYLQLEGLLEQTTPTFSAHKFRLLVSPEQLLAAFDASRAEFLARVLDAAPKARVWSTIDLEQASSALGEPRDRIARALDYLDERGLIELRATGARHNYRVLAHPADLGRLADSLSARFEEHERRQIEKLEAVVGLAEAPECQTRHLLAYFGETLREDCRHCRFCRERRPLVAGPPRAASDPRPDALVARLRSSHPEALAEPRSLARFLCGLTSPRLSKAKLTFGHPDFGRYAHVPFAVVLAWVTEDRP